MRKMTPAERQAIWDKYARKRRRDQRTNRIMAILGLTLVAMFVLAVALSILDAFALD